MDIKRITLTEYLKEIRICPSTHQVTKIGISHFEEKEHELVDQLIRMSTFLLEPLHIFA